MNAALAVQWCVVAALLCALVLQFAVHRAPDLVDPPAKSAGRKIMLAGLFTAGAYLAYLSVGGATAPKPLVLSLGLVALGQMVFGMHKLQDRE